MQKISKKIILIGNFGVGKTSLVRRFVFQKFSDEYLTTLGVKIDKKVLQLGEKELTLLIWDVAGEVSQSKVPKSYYLGAQGIIYVFDLSRPSTFENIKEDLNYVAQVLPNVPQLIVGNKLDLVDQSKLEELKALMPVAADFMTSAKNGDSVEDMFLSLGQKVLC
jgi:small GTP-binding protein